MKARYIITAMTAAILLTGCGKVDQPIEKKNFVSTTTTPFTFSFATTTSEGEPDSENDTSEAEIEDGSHTTTKKKAVTEALVSTTLTTTTTAAPTTTTTTTTTTTPPPATTTTSATESAPPPTSPTETTTTFFDPNNMLINTFDLSGCRTVAYNGIEFSLGDRMSEIEDLLGDPIYSPTAITSVITGKDSIEYHYKMLTIVAEEDMITSIELARTEVNPEMEPRVISGLRFGQALGEIISTFGNAYQLTDPQSLIYSDGTTKIIFFAPNETIERITIRV